LALLGKWTDREAIRVATLLPEPGRLCIAPAMPSRPQRLHPLRKLDRSIVLVGLMGAGKSTIGRRLAARLGLPFVDSDQEIESAAGLRVAEIFERYGEQYFRDGERRVIARLIEGTPKVIATGGGAFMTEETRALILTRATAIWLDADLDVLVQRVGRRPGERPLLRDRDPREALAELAERRNPIYALAHIHVRSQPLPHQATVTEILKAIGQ
jgi:shikimate kinase